MLGWEFNGSIRVNSRFKNAAKKHGFHRKQTKDPAAPEICHSSLQVGGFESSVLVNQATNLRKKG